MSALAQVVCPHCHTRNRVPTERVGDAPTCGRCHKHLFDAHPVVLDGAHLDVHMANSDVPLLVDFWAPWCGPCRVMAPQFEAAARQLEPRFRLAKVDTEAEPTLGARYGIRSIPTLALFVGGREVARQAGALSTAAIVDWASKALAGG